LGNVLDILLSSQVSYGEDMRGLGSNGEDMRGLESNGEDMRGLESNGEDMRGLESNGEDWILYTNNYNCELSENNLI
jgi:ribosomal protein L15E